MPFSVSLLEQPADIATECQKHTREHASKDANADTAREG